MNIRRLQGWALVVSAVIGLFGLLGPGAAAFRVLFLAGALLFIFGVPAIQSLQPMGALGWIGIALLELGAIIAVVFNTMALSGGLATNDTFPLIGALAAALGRVIVGWLTARGRVFAAWVGWAFLVAGVLNLVGGLAGAGGVTTAVGLVAQLLDTAALLGYGLGIAGVSAFRRSQA